MSIRTPRLIALLLAALSLAAPSRSAAADGGPTSPDRDRSIAAVLEAANLRMKAKIDESGILDGQGRHDEAIAALRSVEAIHRESMALVDRLMGAPRSAPTPAVGAIPAAKPRIRVRVEPLAPAGRASDDEPSLVASRAAAYLMSMQRIDGWFRPVAPSESAPDADLDSGRDLHATALATIALLDTVDGQGRPARAAKAATDAVAALLASQSPSGAFGDGVDLEAHALAAWAAAAGRARLPHAPWRAASAEALRASARFALSKRVANGLWRASSGEVGDDWILSAFMLTFLHELLPTKDLFAPSIDIEAEIEKTRVAAAGVDVDPAALPAAARYAWALVRFEAETEVPDTVLAALPTRVAGETAILFGTVARFERSFDFPAWRDTVLRPETDRQRKGGPLDGSWDPVGERARAHGRTYATASELLAFLVPSVPFRQPAGD